MQAEGIKAGDKSRMYDDKGRVLSGWTATGDAVVDGNDVYIPVKHLDGGEGTRIFTKGTQVDLWFGVGGPPPVQDKPETTAVCNACGWEGLEDALPEGQTCPKCGQDEVHFFTPGGGS